MYGVFGSGLPLNSWHFFFLATIAIFICRLTVTRTLRSVFLALINLYFVAHFVRDSASALFLLLSLVTIYAIGRLRKNSPKNWASAIQVGVVVGIWGVLFLVKDPLLAPWINPFFYYPVQIIGFSYLVFRGISYVMEVDLTKDKSILTYLNYMLFFPMILAGPIERYQSFQSQASQIVNQEDAILPAFHRIANGFIKKFVLADNLSSLGMMSIATASDPSTQLLWLGALLQLFLVYLDFSGYCDIVIGLAMLMGFKLRENFNRPFLSTNIQVFWERWHISLGLLLRDYIFNPLVKFAIQTFPRQFHFAIFVFVYFLTMVLVALWHGTTTGFFIFGLIHGFALITYQLKQKYTRRFRASAQSRPIFFRSAITLISIVFTYSFVSLSLILWMNTEKDWMHIFGKMLGVLP